MRQLILSMVLGLLCGFLPYATAQGKSDPLWWTHAEKDGGDMKAQYVSLNPPLATESRVPVHILADSAFRAQIEDPGSVPFPLDPHFSKLLTDTFVRKNGISDEAIAEDGTISWQYFGELGRANGGFARFTEDDILTAHHTAYPRLEGGLVDESVPVQSVASAPAAPSTVETEKMIAGLSQQIAALEQRLAEQSAAVVAVAAPDVEPAPEVVTVETEVATESTPTTKSSLITYDELVNGLEQDDPWLDGRDLAAFVYKEAVRRELAPLGYEDLSGAEYFDFIDGLYVQIITLNDHRWDEHGYVPWSRLEGGLKIPGKQRFKSAIRH